VLQMGHPPPGGELAPTIAHETTRQSGLRHRRGTVSLARFAPGAVYDSFFVCLRDEAQLDAGGLRHPDGLGFAAFASVIEGFEGLERLYRELATSPEWLPHPIPLRSMRRVID
jgi:peptidyl-prolyl cis-trans isomerase A (cyclophilin A)